MHGTIVTRSAASLPKPACNDQRCELSAVCDRQFLSTAAEALHRILFVTFNWCRPAVAWYPTVFLALIGIAGIATALVSVLYGGRSKPYATFLVVSHSGTLPSCTLFTQTSNQLITVFSPPVVQVGDWGRLGEFNQSLVAEAMASRADKLHPDFVLGMGDNFYPSMHSCSTTLSDLIL